jgi:hypothetical protein
MGNFLRRNVMRSHGNIIQALNEAKSVPLVPPNNDNSTPTGRKIGDTIKFLKAGRYQGMDRGTVWRLLARQGDEYEKGKFYSTNIFTKINAVTGQETKSINRFNISGSLWMDTDELTSMLASGVIKVLEPHKPLNQGEITAEDIKEILLNVGADSVLGADWKKMVEVTTHSENAYIWFSRYSFKEKHDEKEIKKLFDAVMKVLERRKYVGVTLPRDFSPSTGTGYPHYIGIPKHQV